MARRVSFSESTKMPEKKEYFSSKYSLKNVTGMKKVGDEAFVLLLNPESFMFQLEHHNVKAKIQKKLGFKGIYDTKIICKRYNEEGVKAEEAPMCCTYADDLFKLAKERAIEECIKLGKDPEVKENLSINSPITFSSSIMYVPLIVLGTTETDSAAKPTIAKLAINNGRRLFAYLEMNKKSYISEIYNGLKEQLANSGEIDSELEGEELVNVMLAKLKTNIIKVTAVPAKSPRIPFQRSYSFVSFANTNIGKKSNEYEAIINYEKDVELKKESANFLDLFESEVDNFIKDWTEEELTTYLITDTKRSENVEALLGSEAKQAEPEIEEKIVMKPKAEPKPEPVVEVAKPEPPQQVIAQKSEVELIEEDTTFDTEESDFVESDETDDIDFE